MYPSIGTWRGAIPTDVVTGNAKKFAVMVKSQLAEWDVANEPIGVDITDIPILRALEAEGVKVVDGQQTLLNASKIKTKEEVELIETSIAIVEAAFWEVVNTTKPGVRELDIAGMMRDVMYRYGAEEMHNINVISGNRSPSTPARLFRPDAPHGRHALYRRGECVQWLQDLLLPDLLCRQTLAKTKGCVQAVL